MKLKKLDLRRIYYANYQLDIFNMINKLYELKKVDKGNKISNVGGWQNSQQLDQFQEFIPLTQLVKNSINLNISFKNTGIWGNISSNAHYNNIHNHSNEELIWSGVYYLQTPLNSGNIVFYSDLDEPISEYCPKVGDLLLFHSSIPHSVNPNNSNQDRISIAFNFLLK